MTFEESLAWLYSTQQFGIKLGLDNIRRLLQALGDPQEKPGFVHVAGTNGKGSVCAMLDSILRASGRRTGLYTSPHLVDFRERIRVNGEKISAPAVAEGLSLIRELSAGWPHSPTFFEIATALAIRHFAAEKCEVVVLETGMGGRLDATNVVTPLVSVITPIALDHTEWLGDTLAKVAGEKAGIIKPGVPVASARQELEAGAVLRERAAAEGATICFVEAPLEKQEIGLRGAYQKENAALAVLALRMAGIEAGDAVIEAGLRDIRWPGRFQVLETGIVLDGGHNPHAAEQLAQNWRETFGEEKAAVIFGAMKDKDYTAMLKILAPLAGEFLFVPVRSQRTASPADLAACCTSRHRICSSVREALSSASGRILVTGSLFLVGEAMKELGVGV